MSNNLRQAAQQALEALEWAWGGEPMGTLERDAITALKQALAEQDRLEGIEAIEKDAGIHVSQQAEPECKCTMRQKLVGDGCAVCNPERAKALSEPEQDPVSLNNGRLTQYPDGSIGVGTPAEPEQEPVCEVIDERGGVDWISFVPPAGTPLYTAPPQREHITDGSPCWCNPDVIEEEGGNVIVHNYEDNWQQYAKPGETAQQCIERHRGEQDALMKLYATPRRPLTDEEIVDIYKKWDATPGVSMADFARAIERAHGIGEQHE